MTGYKCKKQSSAAYKIWKIVKDITNPKSDPKWQLQEGDELIEDETKIADISLIHTLIHFKTR